MSKPVERRVMTPDEMQVIDRMHCVTYPVASWDKRFMRSLSGCVTISEKEVAQLWRLFIRYRRQMDFPDKERLLAFARVNGAPDLRAVACQQRAQAKLDEIKRKYQEAMAGNAP